MSKNKIVIFEGESGLHCDCGNTETVPDRGGYKTFSVWWDTKSSPSGSMAACLKCNGDSQRVEVVARPKK